MYTYNRVKPRGYSAAMMWKRYNDSQVWDWIQIRFWPRDIAEAVINKKLTYATRFRVMLYLVGNGMDPAMARNEVLKMGLGYFDASARQHVRDLYKDLRKNAHKWSYWDERERKILNLEETGFVEREERKNRGDGWRGINRLMRETARRQGWIDRDNDWVTGNFNN